MSARCPLRRPLVAIAIVASHAIAASVDIRGTVQAPGAYPFQGVVVRLETLGMETVADADGAWAFSGNAVGRHGRGAAATNSVHWTGGAVRIDLDRASDVSLDAYDPRGSWLGSRSSDGSTLACTSLR